MNYEITRIYKILQTNNLFVFDCCSHSSFFHLHICLNWEMNERELNKQSNQMIDWWKSHSFLFEIDYEIQTSLSFCLIFISLSFQSLWWIRNHFIWFHYENETQKKMKFNHFGKFRHFLPLPNNIYFYQKYIKFMLFNDGKRKSFLSWK